MNSVYKYKDWLPVRHSFMHSFRETELRECPLTTTGGTNKSVVSDSNPYSGAELRP